MKRILFTGGGSGGHIFPLVAVIQELQKIVVERHLEVELRYYGPDDVYAGYVEREGVKIHKITSSKLRRYFSWLNFLEGPKFFWSLGQALFKIFWFMPDVAFSKGGPGALPVLFACYFYRIPIIIHESDTVPGATSRVSGRFAKLIEVAFLKASDYFPSEKVKVCGNPIRQELLDSAQLDSSLAKKRLGLDENLPLIVVFGGSLGSQRINELILNNVEWLTEKYQVWHQVGVNNYTAYYEIYKQMSLHWQWEKKLRYDVKAFFDKNWGDVLAASDLVIGRSGASIFEIALFGKPALLVPLPESANDHQRINAYEYAADGAAEVIEEDNLFDDIFRTVVGKILENPEKEKQMKVAALKFAKPEAARLVAEDIISFVSF